MERTECSASENLDEFVTCLGPLSTTKNKKNKMKNNNKRRFSGEQIRLLESIFESDSKLEPRKKVQVAKELGLQPRQVAIWFQNRRARWKSKEMEKEFRKLKAEYDILESRFESLKEENHSLLIQVKKLNDVLGKPRDWNNMDKKGLEGNCIDINGKSEARCCLQEGLQRKGNFDSCNSIRSSSSNNNNNNKAGDFGYELLNSTTSQHVDASQSLENWYSFDPARWQFGTNG
ncbi:hypothetical protein FNV43_RR23861 [Rhamnella rubrinervis]|uniref:Homeobox-leucine zipper protein n=1 Tax=Rhamnella rubrinervis TaxID=2594499 RepID=A0A8K0GNJ7_9ROSA|nr:hypothetical protein FNV43_RR23861 [Rhamnella rubrinervis]